MTTITERLNTLLFDSGMEAYGRGEPEPRMIDGHDSFFVAGWLYAQKEWEQGTANPPTYEEELPT